MFVKKYALQTIKKGFIISDGCRAKKPKFIHLCEPFVEPPIKKKKKRKHRQQKYPKNEKLKIASLESIEQKSIKKIPTIQKNK